MTIRQKIDNVEEYLRFREERALEGKDTTLEDWRDHLERSAILSALGHAIGAIEDWRSGYIEADDAFERIRVEIEAVMPGEQEA